MKKKYAALLLSTLLCFGSLSLCFGVRALAEGEGSSSESSSASSSEASSQSSSSSSSAAALITITDAMVSDVTEQLYNGKPIEPSPVVTYEGKTLIKDTDYFLSYNNNINVGTSAVVTVTGKNNYTGTVLKFFTIKSPDKATQVFNSDFSTARTKTYGDSDFTAAATLSTGDGAITYESSDPSVAAVSESSGLVTIKKAGSTVITAKAAETESFASATASYTLTVNKATVVVTALDKTIKQGERAPLLNDPVLNTDYTISGLVGSDALKGEVYMRYQKNGSDVTPDTSETGTYTIAISGFLPPSDNYNDVTHVSGTLTVQKNSGSSGGIGTPVIPGDSEIKGWDSVVGEVESTIEATSEEDATPVVTIDMNGSTVVVRELIEAIRGERIITRFLYDNGIVWSIDGRDVDLIDKAKDVDLGVSIAGSAGSEIPASAIRSVITDATKGTVRMEIRHDGFLGFEGTLSVNVAKATGESVTSRSISRLYGNVANLYYYNPSTGKLEFRNLDYIDESGVADFVMSRASSYVIVIDEQRLGGTADVMRVYNPNSGRHHLTISRDEINFLLDLGWRYEGIAFTANTSGADSLAVYRLYNPYTGEHFFTDNLSEKGRLVYYGWIDEGIAWYSDSKKNVPIFRFYNPNAGDHHFTMNQTEVSRLVVAGWRNEGIAFYAEKGE